LGRLVGVWTNQKREGPEEQKSPLSVFEMERAKGEEREEEEGGQWPGRRGKEQRKE